VPYLNASPPSAKASKTERLLQKLEAAEGTPIKARRLKSMLHDYILWNKLPESKRTLKEVKQFILTGDLD